MEGEQYRDFKIVYLRQYTLKSPVIQKIVIFLDVHYFDFQEK